ncbi:MAG: Fosfomycin resistance protein AbaF [Chlamydiae bacterium]|nr:Fosfomycin resistance protein AbaF [Chlamydiota bacterium]
MKNQEIKLTKVQSHIIKVVTYGGILEWYDIYSFIYLAPLLGKLFFQPGSPIKNLLNAFLLFGTGFLSRPFGAILMGRIGDLIGRKSAFIYSIVIMTIPTFFMGCLPTYQSIGIWAPILFYLLRLIQSIPASGEIPGTICFLYENSHKSNVNFVTSWTFVGNQLGAIVALSEAFIQESFLSEKFMLTWGWRITFWSGGILGLVGIYLRKTLTETPIFKDLQSHHKTDKETVKQVIANHKKTLLLGTLFGLSLGVVFFLFATYIPSFIEETVDLRSGHFILVMIGLILFMTVLIPIFGYIADKRSNKSILYFSFIFLICLIPFLYKSANNNNITMLAIIGILLAVPIAGLSATYPYWVAYIYQPKYRYTALGLAFNFASLIGSLSPAIAIFMLEKSRKNGEFSLFVLVCAVISIFAFLLFKKRKERMS